jgi:hypothetical protein
VSQYDARARSGAPIDPVFEFSEIGHHDRAGALPGCQYKVGEIFSTHLFERSIKSDGWRRKLGGQLGGLTRTRPKASRRWRCR